MNDIEYNRIRLKTLSLRYGGYVAWIIGAIFSYIGFTSESTGNWFWKALGIGLTLLVTVLELWLNDTNLSKLLSDKSTFGDILLAVGGCLSYIYDAYTNILGLCVLMLGITHPDLSHLDWSQLVVPVIAGIFLAGLPEPMIVTSYKNQPKKPQPNNQQNSQKQQQPGKHIKYQPRYKPQLGPVIMQTNPNDNIPKRSYPPESSYLQVISKQEQ